MREGVSLGLDMGARDDAAHDQFMKAVPSLRDEAERKAAILRLTVALKSELSWSKVQAEVERRFGQKGTSLATLKKMARDLRGVDPINYAPALLRDQRGGAAKAAFCDDAKRFFLTTIRDAYKDFPLKRAWADTRDVGRKMGWKVPSYPTVYRWWTRDLTEAQRRVTRLGQSEAAWSMYQPKLRDKTSLAPLEIVSLDGRTLDLFVEGPNGTPVRPVMIALVDVASNFVLGYELSTSENAVTTQRLIRTACARYGTLEWLYPDNGSAFAGHLIAGGTDHKFRRVAGAPVQPFGICKLLGIKIKFALPGNAQAKIAERTFAALSRSIDDRPEFAKAHAGHHAGARPKSSTVPAPWERLEQIVAREVLRHNAEVGRTSQGAQGRSFEQVFLDGLAQTVRVQPTRRQLYLASLEFKPRSVDRHGRIRWDGWHYGDGSTYDDLIVHHGKGRIVVGRDPDNFDAPAIAFDGDGRLICEDIAPVRAGDYKSKDGARALHETAKKARQLAA
ncbi:transposase domain-containing protein [Pseudaestuariivita sp.]|uniref:transposase domain-containing protein n=1 Tax=Pseudaestuariivita sp. TaxID=2211669 RepID=UPI0040582720